MVGLDALLFTASARRIDESNKNVTAYNNNITVVSGTSNYRP